MTPGVPPGLHLTTGRKDGKKEERKEWGNAGRKRGQMQTTQNEMLAENEGEMLAEKERRKEGGTERMGKC